MHCQTAGFRGLPSCRACPALPDHFICLPCPASPACPTCSACLPCLALPALPCPASFYCAASCDRIKLLLWNAHFCETNFLLPLALNSSIGNLWPFPTNTLTNLVTLCSLSFCLFIFRTALQFECQSSPNGNLCYPLLIPSRFRLHLQWLLRRLCADAELLL